MGEEGEGQAGDIVSEQPSTDSKLSEILQYFGRFVDKNYGEGTYNQLLREEMMGKTSPETETMLREFVDYYLQSPGGQQSQHGLQHLQR